MKKIAIIGAGIAGLTLARTMVRQGWDVKVFEKSRGLGGRASTRRLSWSELDLGVQYFTAQHPEFCKEVDRWLKRRQIAQWRFTPHTYDGRELRASPDEQKRWVGNSSMSVLCRDVGVEVPFVLNQLVTSLKRTSKGWTVYTDQGQFENFDWVVSAVPQEQAQPILQGHTSILEGMRPLHRSVWALALATEGPVTSQLQGVFSQDAVRWLSRASMKPNFKAPHYRGTEVAEAASKDVSFDDLWVLHFDEDWSEQKGKALTEQSLVSQGSRWLNKMLRAISCPPVTVRAHNVKYWRYAQMRTPYASEPAPMIDTHHKLAAIGAWCGSGRFEDGYLSGRFMADALQ